MGYRLSVAAGRDLKRIYAESAEAFGELQADRYAEGLRATLRFLGDNPRAARERVEYDPPVRIHRFRAHVIVYLLDDNGVMVVRIRHGHEDWASSPLGD